MARHFNFICTSTFFNIYKERTTQVHAGVYPYITVHNDAEIVPNSMHKKNHASTSTSFNYKLALLVRKMNNVLY